MAAPQTFLRQRNAAQGKAKKKRIWKTFCRSATKKLFGAKPGEVFRVPTTHDVLTLFDPSYSKSHLDLLNLALLGLQLVLFAVMPRNAAKLLFLFYFAFWRGAYDAGLGWILTKQSKKKWIVREVQKLGWLDPTRRPNELPLEYNTWLLFRQAVDVILLNDFVAYCMFAFSCFRVPEGLSVFVHVLRWVGGCLLIGFNLWVKTEAHNVVKDYGWYWGDVFFQRGALVFDGVFELAPHPMYSDMLDIMGFPSSQAAYAVLFVSLAGHAAQFAFLVFFENPHIERMYGQRKAISKRTPMRPRSQRSSECRLYPSCSSIAESDEYTSSTPSATEGDTATETDLETETETEGEANVPVGRRRTRSGHQQKPSNASSFSLTEAGPPKKKKPMSQHDLFNKYFRRDTVVFKNLDLLRANDATLVLIIAYSLVISVLPRVSDGTALGLHFAHALAWCLFHCFGLGLLLRAQGQSKTTTYPANDGDRGAIVEAFANWKAIYNLSLCMSYVSFVGVVWQTYSIPNDWTVGHELLRHTIGALLVGLHVWAALECFEVLGLFGWFFGDFFMEFPANLEYTGIYRYLNNPEVMGGAACGSKLVLTLAVIRHLSQWWFLKVVENPHMRSFTATRCARMPALLRSSRTSQARTARILDSRAGRHAPELRRVATEVAKEVKGTFDKVYEETADVVEEFLAKSRPKISEVVQDTKVLLQQSRERLVITRIANDISSYDTTKYKFEALSNPDGSLRFYLGEPIRLKWEAPHTHSRKDWVGIYRIGANKSSLVTRTSSMGLWVPVHDEEWDGDSSDADNGVVTFKGNTLPWLAGRYEVRYHHDGKYNVMGLVAPIEIYIEKPSELTFESVRENLMRVVPLCLDSDASLIPSSTTTRRTIGTPDDFTFWSEKQARRICSAIRQTFDVEYAPEVVVADANLSALARRILISKRF
ncbi:hypothetical protein DFH06DRAFT_1272697 [Mycena polygramma]|nr:hypothetical protein DFH06DRAFT_1272697 [Mycena polygramma]